MPANLKLLFTQLNQRYDGEYAPNVEALWDESDIEQNSDGWDTVVAGAYKNIGSNYENVAILTVAVDEKLLYGAPETPAPSDPDWIVSRSGQFGLRLIVGEINDGETWTTVIDAWDTYVLEENGEGFQKILEEAVAKVGSYYNWVKIVDLYLPEKVIDQALAPWTEVHQGLLIPVAEPEPELDPETGFEL